MKNKKVILVTGGAGYIGSHICKHLFNKDFIPVVYDNLSLGHSSFIKWGPYIIGDILDKNSLDSAFQKYKPFAVIHLASKAIVSESKKDPQNYYVENVVGSLNLFETMLKHGVKYLIFSSSCSIYGYPEMIPISEDHKIDPISPYGTSKMIIEKILQDYSDAYGFLSISLRYFNAAGADREAEIGEKHVSETHLIPLAIETALKNRPYLSLFGTDFDTNDGTAVRDYIHVEDLAIAHLKALSYLPDTGRRVALNLGTGKGFSVLEVISEVERCFKTKFEVRFEKRRQGDPPILIADYSKAKKLLKWEPKYSDLKTIVSSAGNWHRKLLNKR